MRSTRRFVGHVGYLTKREVRLGWHVYFPGINEEAFFVTNDGCCMLRYAAASKDDILQPHIYAHQREIMNRQGMGVDTFTTHAYSRLSSQMLSYHTGKHGTRGAEGAGHAGDVRLHGHVVDYVGDFV